MEVIELSAGTIQVAVMVEQIEPPEHLLLAASIELDQPLRLDEAMLRDVAQEFEITLGKLE